MLHRHTPVLYRLLDCDTVREGEARMKMWPHSLCIDCDLSAQRGPGVCDGCPVYSYINKLTEIAALTTIVCVVALLIIVVVGMMQ